MRAAFARGDYRTALRIARAFRIGTTAEDRHHMSMAYECLVHPQFYRPLGLDIDATIQKGIATLEMKLCQ